MPPRGAQTSGKKVGCEVDKLHGVLSFDVYFFTLFAPPRQKNPCSLFNLSRSKIGLWCCIYMPIGRLSRKNTHATLGEALRASFSVWYSSDLKTSSSWLKNSEFRSFFEISLAKFACSVFSKCYVVAFLKNYKFFWLSLRGIYSIKVIEAALRISVHGNQLRWSNCHTVKKCRYIIKAGFRSQPPSRGLALGDLVSECSAIVALLERPGGPACIDELKRSVACVLISFDNFRIYQKLCSEASDWFVLKKASLYRALCYAQSLR